MNNEIEYTLLELIEGPKRINNITHDKLFKYLLEASETQDRFESFMHSLEVNSWWAYLGFALMASDMIPLATLFEAEFSEITQVKYLHGSMNEHSIFNMLLSYFDRGILSDKKHRVYFIRNMAENLATDEYEFCITCLKQVYKQEVFDRFRIMFENGKMNVNIQELFSFCMNNKCKKVNSFTKMCLPIKQYRKYVKVGSVLFYEGKLLDIRIANPILKFIETTSSEGRNGGTIKYPNICELYVDENNKPFMYVSTVNGYLLRQPQPINDASLIELLYQGYDTLICCDRNVVKSFISKDTGFVTYESIECKSVKRINMPLLILGLNVDILVCECIDGSEITAFVPTRLIKCEINCDKPLNFVKYNSTYYLLEV